MIPCDDGEGPAIPVPLHCSKKRPLNGNFLQLLRRLDRPETMDDMTLTVFRCTAGDVTRTLGSCVRDYFQRDGRFRDWMGILVTSVSYSISIRVSTISSVEGPTQRVTFATFTAILHHNSCIDFIARAPRECCVLGGDLTMDALRTIVTAMANINTSLQM